MSDPASVVTSTLAKPSCSESEVNKGEQIVYNRTTADGIVGIMKIYCKSGWRAFFPTTKPLDYENVQ